MTTVNFSVDAHLLRELGERLVGRPHIALAELIKNSYDADATQVVIEFTGDRIVVTDDGHGMNWDAFESRWMRIGSAHKEEQGVSPALGRPLTGSKGVGRLAVQLLADRLELQSRVVDDPGFELIASIDWTRAVEAGLLTMATAEVERRTVRVDTAVGRPGSIGLDEQAEDAEDSGSTWTSGVRLVLTGLNQTWDRKAFSELAEEIWPLQPPFRGAGPNEFKVVLKSDDDDLVDEFNRKMSAVLELWSARIRGRLLAADVEVDGEVFDIRNPHLSPSSRRAEPRIAVVSLEFAGEDPRTIYYRLPDCHIDKVDFEVRVYNLKHRQPYGIAVSDARRYLNEYGGIHVYDAGFHLPYYGPETDWLGIEMDHSHRRATSDYLPPELTTASGAEYLPTNSRLYGIVEVSTSHEAVWAKQEFGEDRAVKSRVQKKANTPASRGREGLRIQVTRDRLVDTLAYRNLATIVRSAIDLYAMEQAKRAFEAVAIVKATSRPAPQQVKGLGATLDLYRREMPEEVYRDLRDRVDETNNAISVEYDARGAQIGLLASLATAGVSALAYEHEVGKQFLILEQIGQRLRSTGDSLGLEVADEIDLWTRRARATRGLFAPLLDRSNRETRTRLKASALVDEVFDQVRGLARGTQMVNRVAGESRLPVGSFAEWSALFQNLAINAMNAMLDSEGPRLEVSSGRAGRTHYLWVQDTGYGIDLNRASRFFLPFERESHLSEERAELGLGGTGLGLTIVAMLADELKCRVEFVTPHEGFSTCAQISWEES